jgi:hypothetical protein
MRRHAVGLIALVLLLSGLALWLWAPDGDMSQMMLAACLRVGMLMTVVWLAYRDVERLPPWLLGMLPLMLLVLLVSRKWFFMFLPLILAMAILRPRIGPRK